MSGATAREKAPEKAAVLMEEDEGPAVVIVIGTDIERFKENGPETDGGRKNSKPFTLAKLKRKGRDLLLSACKYVA
jgi:hypothetical protein